MVKIEKEENHEMIAWDLPPDLENIYGVVVHYCMSARRFDNKMICKGFKLEDEKGQLIIEKMIERGVIARQDDKGNYFISDTYNHSDYLLELERKEDEEKAKKKKEKENRIDLSKILFYLAIIALMVSLYFLVREPVSLIILLLFFMALGAYLDKLPKGIPPVIAIIICVSTLLLVNSIAPIFGDKYSDRIAIESTSQQASEDTNVAQNSVNASLDEPSSSTSQSAKTYTKEQLNDMVNSGNYPDQLSPTTTELGLSFTACKNSALDAYNQVIGEYPAKKVVDSSILFIVKLWTNDGAIVITCSEPDLKSTMTQSQYK
ncbi:hypothetical protein [Xenorhabdus cabanillasii]|uniref:hypothetical protein n=1 Tax=Xenorhabdus cabanillasii TaxID=351673 RepID=UPI002B40D4D3|nr:hypothetical protein [Xenorhabdus sp. Flor]